MQWSSPWALLTVYTESNNARCIEVVCKKTLHRSTQHDLLQQHCSHGLVTPIPNCLCIYSGLQHVVSPTEASLVTMVLQQALVCSISEANMSASATCQPNCADDKVSQENSIVPATCGPARLQREQKCSCFWLQHGLQVRATMMEAKAAAKRKGAFVMMVEQDLMLARFLAGLYSHKVIAVPFLTATVLLLRLLYTLVTVVVCFTVCSPSSSCPTSRQRLRHSVLGGQAASLGDCQNMAQSFLAGSTSRQAAF